MEKILKMHSLLHFLVKKKHGTYLDLGCYHPIRG